MRIDICIGMCIVICTDMRIGICIDMRIGICIDMRIDICINMRIVICIDIRIDICIDICTYICILDAQDGLKPVLELKPTASAISCQPSARGNAKQMCRAKAHCRSHPLSAPLGLKPPSQS